MKGKQMLNKSSTVLGAKVYENALLTKPGTPYEVKRTLKERLWSRPWQPLKATTWVTPQVPSSDIFTMPDGSLVMHPETVQLLRNAICEFDKEGPR